MQKASRSSLVGVWVERKSLARRKRLKGKFLCKLCVPTSIMAWLRHIRPLVLLASKYGFTGETFFPASAAKASRHNQRASRSPRLHLVREATAVAIVAVRMVEAVVSEAIEVGIVVSVRRETDHRVRDRRVIVDLVHHVPRVTGPHAHRVSVSHVLGSRPLQHKLRRILPLQPRQHHRLHRQLTLVPLRASSRGRAKPCYWHRHVQNIAAS